MFSRPLYEARIADLKEAHAAEVRALDKVIDSLAEQIEYLRATFGKPHITPSTPTTPGLAWQGEGLTDLGFDPEELQELASRHLSEEEEDLLALRENGLLSSEEYRVARERLGN